MKTHQFIALILGVFCLMALPTYGQTPISIDGYMDVKWGATLQAANSALPDFRKGEYTANKNMFHGEIPCNTTLSNETDTGFISLLFYEGKFIAIHRELKLPSLPDGLSINDLKSSLNDLLRSALTPTDQPESKKADEIEIRLGGISGSNNNSNPISISVFIANKALVVNSMSKRDEGLNKNRTQFLDSIAEKILTP